VKAEYDDNFELGARSQLFDNMAIVNLTLFHERFRNFQINTFNGLTFAVTNFRHAYADGFELETEVQPMEGLTLNNSVTYADSRYGRVEGDDVVVLVEDVASPNRQLILLVVGSHAELRIHRGEGLLQLVRVEVRSGVVA
jgi:outer membrane receptor protein involved in Fe transport